MHSTNVLKLTLAVTLFLGMMTSCEKSDESYGLDDTNNISISPPGGSGDDEDDHDEYDFDLLECGELLYPLTIIFPDKSEFDVADEDALEVQIEEWYAQNTSVKDPPLLHFPLDIEGEDGTVLTLMDQTELDDFNSLCEEDDDDDDDEDDFFEDFKEECFELKFPISFVLPDSSVHDATDIHIARNILADYLAANPGTDEDDILLVFPITLLFDDGSSLEINSDDELEDAEDLCDE